MLVWEQEAKPSTIHASKLAQPLASAANAAPAAVQLHSDKAVANAADSERAPTTTRRVNAADKRIINGQTDVNQLVRSEERRVGKEC